MKKEKQGLILILIIFAMFFALQIDKGKAKAQVDTIKIGALGPLAITPGKDMETGAKLAVEQINAAGGVTVGGTNYDLELIVETSSSPSTGLPDATTAVTSARKLMDQDDVTAMLGLFRTEVTIAVMAELDRPFLGVGSTAPIITPYFWRTGPSNGSILTRGCIDLYAFGLSKLGVIGNITIVREDAAWSLAMSGGIKHYLHTALPAAYGTPMYNFTDDVTLSEGASLDAAISALTPLKSEYGGLKVNAIMQIFSGPVGKYVTEAWASLDMPQMLAGINVESQASTFFKETEGASYGEIEMETCPPDQVKTPKTTAFRNAYSAKYGEQPTYTSFASYDAVNVIVDAIERADATDVASLQLALADTDYEGAGYWIKYTSEPGSQLGVNSTGQPAPIPGAPTDITVHDLYTRASIGAVDDKYIQGYFAQWQQGGAKKTIWTRIGENVTHRDLTAHIEWPIDHSAHGYVTSTSTTTETGTLTETETESESETTKEPESIPGFELPLILMILVNLAIVGHMRQRKKQ